MSKKIIIKVISHISIFFSIAAILISARLPITSYSQKNNHQNIIQSNLSNTNTEIFGPPKQYISIYSQFDEQKKSQNTDAGSLNFENPASVNNNNPNLYSNANNDLNTNWPESNPNNESSNSSTNNSTNGSLSNSNEPSSDSNPPVEDTNQSQKNLSIKSGGKIVVDSPYEILSKVAAAEVSSNFHPEAIKAQVIASHSFIRYNNDRGISPSVNLREPGSTISTATRSVSNKLIYHNNSIANTLYHATAAGRTNSSTDVWGGHIPYLISVASKYDDGNIFSGAKNWGEKVIINKNKVKSLVKQNVNISLNSNDELNWFRFPSEGDNRYTSGGYINKIYLGGKSYTGRDLREKALVDGSKLLLKSAKFDIDYNGNDFMFTTYGYGHGVGLSQNGANGYAKNEGYTYDKILKHYYPGITIK